MPDYDTIYAAMKQRQVMLMINPPIPLRFDGIVKYAREHDWHLTLANRLVRAPRGWNGDGALVTLRGDAETSRFVEGLAKTRIPVVDLTFYMPEVDVPRVIPDYTSAGRIAGAHFSEIGLKRTVWFSTIWTKVHSLFFDGLAERWPTTQKIVLATIMPKTKLDDVDRFADVMSPRLLALQKPVGILTYNDEEAARILALCLELGIKVPDEIAILGIGNEVEICENMQPTLTSILPDFEGGGYLAAQLLDDILSRRIRSRKPVMRSHGVKTVVVRASTQDLKGGGRIVRHAKEFIRLHAGERIAVGDVAMALSVSRRTLEKRFREVLERGVADVLRQERLERVCRLLRETDRTITDIALDSGFASPTHLNAAFKRFTGSTMRVWRKKEI